MTNRICPTDELLSEYVSGVIDPGDKVFIEKHLSVCSKCRIMIVKAFRITKEPKMFLLLKYINKKIMADKWLLSSSVFLICSFIFKEYFFQFLIASLLTGIKWIIDSKTTKMLIMINEARKDHDKLNKLIEKH